MILKNVRGGLPWPFKVGALLIMIGVRLNFVGQYGINLPFWDQWRAIGSRIYLPWREGTLSFEAMIRPHNVHRIFTTRLLDLLLLIANGSWDIRLELVVNTLIHAFAMWCLCRYLGRALSARTRALLYAATVSIFCLPFGWQNSLCGFQSQFYFSLLIQISALTLLLTNDPWRKRWCLALPLLPLGLLSMASGFLAAPAAAGILVFEAVIRRRVQIRELIATSLLLGFSVYCVLITPSVPQHAILRAQSLGMFLHAFARALAWPGPYWLVVLFQAPWLFVTYRYLKRLRREDSAIKERLLVGFGLWVVGFAAVIAYGRGAMPLESRYLDPLSVGIVVNLSCLFYLVENAGPAKKIYAGFALGVWATACILAFGITTPRAHQDAAEFSSTLRTQKKTVKAFIASDDERIIIGAKPRAIPIPIPLAPTLVQILRNPTYLEFLPPDLRNLKSNRSSAEGKARITPLSELALRNAWVIIAIGMALSIIGISRFKIRDFGFSKV